MKTNRFKQAIAAREQQVGIWLSLASGYCTDIVADVGFDWALIDMEHSPNDVRSVLHQLQALEVGGSTAIVRPAWNDPVMVKRLLDIGAQGLLFPMIQSPEEAKAAVAATRYPPHGIRGVSMGMRGSRFARDKDYFDRIGEELCVLVQVETKTALDQVEEIAAVDGVDGVFFGPADIAASLGQIGNILDENLWQIIGEAAQKVHALGKPTGTLIGNPERVRKCFEAGFSFVSAGTDVNLLARGAEALLASAKTQA